MRTKLINDFTIIDELVNLLEMNIPFAKIKVSNPVTRSYIYEIDRNNNEITVSFTDVGGGSIVGKFIYRYDEICDKYELVIRSMYTRYINKENPDIEAYILKELIKYETKEFINSVSRYVKIYEYEDDGRLKGRWDKMVEVKHNTEHMATPCKYISSRYDNTQFDMMRSKDENHPAMQYIEYDENGDVIRKCDLPSHTEEFYKYNDDGLLVRCARKDFSNKAKASSNTTYAYEKKGNRLLQYSISTIDDDEREFAVSSDFVINEYRLLGEMYVPVKFHEYYDKDGNKIEF